VTSSRIIRQRRHPSAPSISSVVMTRGGQSCTDMKTRVKRPRSSIQLCDAPAEGMRRRGRAPAERLLRRLVLDQLDRAHQTEAADVAYRRMAAQRLELAEEIATVPGAALRQLLALEDLDVLERRGA
jgi:hypothetical protein